MDADVDALVSAPWLHEQLEAGRPDLVVLDASIDPYRGHTDGIPGARVFDIDGEFSRADVPIPHTMIPAAQFQAQVRRLGVDAGALVVVYDAAGIYSSPRAWWMFRAMGHDRVAVLDGGLPGWRSHGYPVEALGAPASGTDDEPDRQGDFVAHPDPGAFVDREQVLALLADPGVAVLDARSRERFEGTAPEPRPGLRGGHMPGSRSLPLTDLLVDGHLRAPGELAALVGEARADAQRIVTTCGSGVTACGIALAAHLSGVSDLTVYDGSWSEWGRPDGPPVASCA
ncbi:sulfurtransferase [Nocardioides sp. YIM 152588]|uniref:sulfurtransferase n=1 Tax=Nocardioides sp. YIM 152588 TaxID=3158259 RepID=UPI0032E3FEDA